MVASERGERGCGARRGEVCAPTQQLRNTMMTTEVKRGRDLSQSHVSAKAHWAWASVVRAGSVYLSEEL